MTPEGAILKSILEYLAVCGVWSMRINTGAIASEYKGRTRFHRYGRPGCADILAIYAGKMSEMDGLTILWIEVKTEKGRQSDLQKLFQAEVEAEGHTYLIARSIDDVEALLK